jgi:hypothetical protein
MSATLHAAIFVLAIWGLPELYDARQLEIAPIVVDLVEVAEETTPQPVPEPEPPEPEVKTAEVEPEPPKPEPPKAPPPPPEPPPPPPPEPELVKAPPPPPPPEPEPLKLAPPPEPEPVPEPAKKVALAPPEPAPAPKPKPKPPQKKVKPTPKPAAKPKRKTEDFNADRIAALLDKKIKEKPRKRLPPEPEAQKVAALSAPPQVAPRRLATQALTLSEKDAIRLQIERCWSVPAGARDAENLRVKIRIYLNPDGSLRQPPEIVDSARMERPGEEFYRSAAESARRAVLNPRCSPLQNLPVSKYERWREIELTFDPKEMLGG